MKNQLPVTIPNCTLSQTSAVFNEGLELKDWMASGKILCRVSACCLWWIGDWLLYGVKAYGDKTKLAREYAEQMGMGDEVLRGAIKVSQSVAVGTRVPTLSWSHHREVISFNADAQSKWLNEAATNNWTVSELRQHIRRHSAVFKDDANEPKLGLFSWASSAQELFRHMAAEDRKQPIEQWPDERIHAVWGLIGNIEPYIERVKKRAQDGNVFNVAPHPQKESFNQIDKIPVSMP